MSRNRDFITGFMETEGDPKHVANMQMAFAHNTLHRDPEDYGSYHFAHRLGEEPPDPAGKDPGEVHSDLQNWHAVQSLGQQERAGYLVDRDDVAEALHRGYEHASDSEDDYRRYGDSGY